MKKMVDKNGLNEEDNLIEKYTEEYTETFTKYDQLGKVLNQDLEKLLEDKNIDIFSVDCRIKDVESYLDKIKRKTYDNPIKDITDICGLRIICYYTSDLDKIYSLIENEFVVVDMVDEGELLEEDEFGYLSRHYIVKLKENWLKTPSYRNLDDVEAEIQIRTILQHAWADISHKLYYKKKVQIPNQFERRLNSMSCILENSDLQFDSLRVDREKYISEMSGKAIDNGTFDVEQELNLDSLQAFLDFHFEDRKRDIEYLPKLFDEIINYDKESENIISIKTLSEAFNQCKDCLAESELKNSNLKPEKEMRELKESDYKKFIEIAKEIHYYNQIGAARTILRCYFDDHSTTDDSY
jgi:ppGpp synthetase/RelA/SpoT-type nucleotidyltranferase